MEPNCAYAGVATGRKEAYAISTMNYLSMYVIFLALVIALGCGKNDVAMPTSAESEKKPTDRSKSNKRSYIDIEPVKVLAEEGDIRAQDELGFRFYAGRGVGKDLEEAFKWFRMAAEQDYPPAQNYLGIMYAKGQGVEMDEQEAVRWFLKAAEQNLNIAQYQLGKMYASGRGVERDVVIAYAWFNVAREEANKGSLEKIMTIEQISEAMELSKELLNNIESSKKEFLETKTKAEAGHPQAQCRLGEMYVSGRRVKKGESEAAKLFRKAKQLNHPPQQETIGFKPRTLQEVEKDNKEAVKWYRRAAEQNHHKAQYNLGFMYYRGKGVEKDVVTSFSWYSIALANGYADAKRSKDALAEKMTPEQIAKAGVREKELLGKIKTSQKNN